MESLPLKQTLAKFTAAQLEKKLAKGEFTKNQRPWVRGIIASKKKEEASKPTKAESVGGRAEHGPSETTYTMTAFTDDSKGLRAGDMVRYPKAKNGTDTMTGKLQRIFGFFRESREEGKILGDDGKRYYRFLKDIDRTKVEETVAGVVGKQAEA